MVKYRYNSFTPTISTCAVSNSICTMDVADCKRTISNYDRVINSGKDVIFKLGTEQKNIYMLP